MSEELLKMLTYNIAALGITAIVASCEVEQGKFRRDIALEHVKLGHVCEHPAEEKSR